MAHAFRTVPGSASSGFQLPPDPTVPSHFMTSTSLLADGQLPGLFQPTRHRRGYDDPEALALQAASPASTALQHRRQRRPSPFAIENIFSNPFGGHFGGMDVFSPIETMMTSMMSHGGGHDAFMSSGGSRDLGSGGSFQSSVMVMSSTLDAHGNPRVERYMKTSRGNTEHQMHEVKEAYSNSHTGTDKMAMERGIRGRGMRVLRERNRHTQEMVENSEPVNMNEEDVEVFEAQWNQSSGRYLPPPPVYSHRMLENRQSPSSAAALYAGQAHDRADARVAPAPAPVPALLEAPHHDRRHMAQIAPGETGGDRRRRRQQRRHA